MSGTRNLEGLKTQALTCIEAAYDKGYKAAKQDAIALVSENEYERGLKDAWECAKKIVTDKGLNYEELEKIFNSCSMDVILERFSASEAMAKIKEYEDRQKKIDDKIHVGDEVIFEDKKYIIVNIAKYGSGESVVMVNDTTAFFTLIENVEKTGRKYPVAEILEGLKK